MIWVLVVILLIIVISLSSKSKKKTKLEIKKLEKEMAEKPKSSSIGDEISKLKKLLDDGVLNEDEFNKQKSKILDS